MTATKAANAVWTRLDWIALSAITLVGGLLRVVRVGSPDSLIFDEVYYAKDACFYLNAADPICEVTSEVTWVHPPLGKWLLALGIRIFGYDAVGWRIAAVVAGTITIALLYLLARRLLKSTLGASIAAGLLAVDFLHFVQSRTSMVDIFVTLFAVAAFLFLIFDRDRMLAGGSGNGLLDRPWRLAAGAMAGAAVASKWSGGLVVVAVLVLTVIWELASRKEEGLGRSVARMLKEEGLSIFVWLVLVPLSLYLLTYIGRLDGAVFASPFEQGSIWRTLWDRQKGMFEFHRGLDASHPYASPPWSWILLKRPVSYHFLTTDSGDYREIFASGSPLVWWSSIVALAFAVGAWIRKRDFSKPEGFILFGFATMYLPWFVLAGDRLSVFLFYMLPVVPFMCLAIAYAALRLGTSWEARAAQGVFVLAAVSLFGFYYPLLADVAIPQSSWQKRIWVFDSCEKPEGTPTKATVTTTTDGTVSTEVTETTDNASLPPKGWCWI